MSYVLDTLEQAGFSEVMVNVHYLAEQIEAFAESENRRRKNLRLFIQDEKKEILGSGGAIAQAASWLFAKETAALGFNADSLMKPDLRDLVREHQRLVKRHDVLCTLSVLQHSDAGRRYTGLTVADGLVREFLPPEPNRTKDSLHFPGVYCIEKAAVDYLAAPGEPCSIMEKLWAPLVKESRLGAWNYLGHYQDLGTVDDIKAAERVLAAAKG